MRRVAYKTVLQNFSALWSGEVEGSTQDAGVGATFINRRAREFWGSYWWPELMVCEARQFRADWLTGTTYAAADERYYVPAQNYYQSLHGTNAGNAPATLSGGSYVENSAHWALCASSYSGDDWVTGTTYTFVAGSPRIVRYPADNRFYQLTTTHTAGATLDTTKFGILTPFVRSIGLEQTNAAGVALTAIGEVRRVWPMDPNVYAYWMRGGEVAFEAMAAGIVVRGTGSVVYPEYRLRAPTYLSTAGGVTAWAATTTYGLADQAYDDTTGDFYRSLQAANLNHAVTDAAWWVRIDFPYVLSECVAQAAYADMLRADGQLEKWGVEMAEARRLRDVEVTLAERQVREQLRVVR